MKFKNWLIFLLVLNSGFVLAQTADNNYPTKPIRIIIPQSSGSATDSLIRLIAPKLTEQLGQSFILENRLGAGGIIGADTVAKAAPDGYTLLIGATSWITIAPHVYPKLSYDPIKDFSPISLFAVGQNVLAVPANSPYTSLKDLVSQMKAQPNILNMASAGIGSTSHLAGVMLTSLAGVSAVHQFVHIGQHSYIAGGSLVSKDVPPYIKAVRNPLSYGGVNSVGLKSRGFDLEKINHILDIYRYIFSKGMNTTQALEFIEEEIPATDERDEIVTFIRDSGRGVIKRFGKGVVEED